ncbi:sigma-70 family RNA polymerase sigma factor [Sphingobium naphthae]|jgi:RNA polymerase sigma factor for flagellar operon FliA|uniref:RNA polymerase sigma factor FliA n=1 Tax=Sphingobium naphthae TaxID=1886786 RepID=A0ABU3ZWB5_9SPHN|nr:RNA polymerase sigma factor FliA [Sphingobium naphthae]MEA3542684.1 RNA polymerase sigma factor FliA [Pseudomonadota bacterium]PDH68029.1 MAG: FliA/WhiG family RNA polymerase sigma factor [Sphingomonadaceae bacterium MED-G03]MCC4252316.1 RNA polymerase sigma factor FliA [Sphingobium naphthae]MDV5823824.1 RNA polymerase sigma factor FliA [Sphingobium naphthae]MEC8036625.1 RNA polymerase sigma factor FliA [Pseudomonadota bacterium]|tara:strand:- start:195 stop:926 length:732 start_codon:yes stop_codon:yes gene_type:complete
MYMNKIAAGAHTYGKPGEHSPERLARQYMPLVRKIAWHVHGRVSTAIEVEDLLQIGMVALVEAANSFEDRGLGFAAYAQLRVRGAMIDHLRRQATLCRSAMAKRKEIAGVRNRLEQQLGRLPTEAEMSSEMGLEPAAYREVADSVEMVQHTSMDEVYSDQSMWFADVEDRADQVLERESLKKALAACIGELPQREAMVLQLYFVEEMNLEEIGQTLDIGAARVCQIKKAALDKLREKLRDWDE